ncbi:MAG: DPP IV N-terminal domain-containing protein [Anaerolineae bacterium]
MFTSRRAGSADIFLLNLTNGALTNLTHSADIHENDAEWSPDGTQIAFASNRDGDYDIYVMNADGSNVRQVTFNDVDDTNPAWVP